MVQLQELWCAEIEVESWALESLGAEMGALHPMQLPFTPTATWLQVCEDGGSTWQSSSTLFL